MPYLKQEDRKEGLKELAEAVGLLIREQPVGSRAGLINYFLFRAIGRVFDMPHHGLSHIPPEGTQTYAQLNEIVGAIECFKLELYRRLIGPYEDGAIERNGDVV